MWHRPFIKISLCSILCVLLHTKWISFLVKIKVKILNIIENVQNIQYFYFKAYFRTFKQKGRSPGYSAIKKPGPDIWHAVWYWFFFPLDFIIKNSYLTTNVKKWPKNSLFHVLYLVRAGVLHRTKFILRAELRGKMKMHVRSAGFPAVPDNQAEYPISSW